MPRGSSDLDLAAAIHRRERFQPTGAETIVYHAHTLTLCSITSFLHTLSKYPSHIFLNLSRISFSTSSSDSWVKDGKDPLVAVALADLVASSESVPGSEAAEICFAGVGGTIPRYGRE